MNSLFDIGAVVEYILSPQWVVSFIYALGVAAIAALGGTGVFAFRRRSKSVSQGDAKYFKNNALMRPPMDRPAYSDRMAYMLAEMSALAYFKFEGHGQAVEDAVRQARALQSGSEDKLRKWLEEFAEGILIEGLDSERAFRQILEKAGFDLLETINVYETQGFIARRNASRSTPYLVVAFRGTEKKIKDWLTDIQAKPTTHGTSRVHSGFYEALSSHPGESGKTVLKLVGDVLDGPNAKDENGARLPVYVTGHSLGGALAILTTKYLVPDVNGACYTYGAPRVANYEFFSGIKTPVFRVVNSSDIVPRVPPGAALGLLVKIIQGLAWLTRFMPVVSVLLEKLESKLDQLHGYRHYGDQRYLTDVETGRFKDVKLVYNPPAIDRIIWMWQHVGVTMNFLAPVKSHGMAIYRNKLVAIAERRNHDG